MKILQKFLIALACVVAAIAAFTLVNPPVQASTWDSVLFKAEDLLRVSVQGKKESIDLQDRWRCVDASVSAAIAASMTQSIAKNRGGECNPVPVVMDVTDCPAPAAVVDATQPTAPYGLPAFVIVDDAAKMEEAEIVAWAASYRTYAESVVKMVSDDKLKAELPPVPGCEPAPIEGELTAEPVPVEPVEELPEVTVVTTEVEPTP